MAEIHLSLDQARRLQLAAMGLLTSPKKVATKQHVLDAIRAMHALQIDTISVVARSPYLVLFSRLGVYQPRWLDELLAEAKLFEYWSHAACFLPMDDYPLYRVRQLAFEQYGFHRTATRLDDDAIAHLNLLDHVRSTGAVRATDFEHEDGSKGNGWWDWKPDKLRLETLFAVGELMVSRREKFHRIYDIRERVLPKRFLDDAALPTREHVHREFTARAVKAVGIAQRRWIDDYFWRAQKKPRMDVDPLVDSGHLLRVRVEGWKEVAYAHSDHRALLKAASGDKLVATHSTLLSPFDPLVWDRERALALFNFDYRIECYTPEAKRKYGYFTLPILVRGELVGRLDAKAHRARGVFEVRALHLEVGVTLDDALASDIVAAVVRCANWHRTPTVSITKAAPASLLRKLQQAVKQQNSSPA